MPEPSPLSVPAPSPRVALLLSTYNGERFLDAQLDSFAGQSVTDWTLYWRDDGSADGTVPVMQRFMAGAGAGRCRAVESTAHLGATESFLTLLRAAVAEGAAAVAFADQDDVWLPEKLALGLAALGDGPDPVLYCSRQRLVDSALTPLGESAALYHDPCFPAALTQNIATGCTLLLNRPAALLVARSRAPDATLHDWWSYLVVSAAGGRIVADPTPTVLYRQHGRNLVGAPPSLRRRALAALERGPAVFMSVLRGHVAALRGQPELLSGEARAALDVIAAGLTGGLAAKLRALRLPGLYRQTWQETLLFRLWFLVG